MRPVSVTMAGFGTFADAVTVDFEGAEVFALVGPTGSGKSTVIDAICFALYGSVPRLDDRRAVGQVVHTGTAEARVSLTFELAGRRYVAARVVRKDKHGRASTRDARLEVVDGVVIAGTAREMDVQVPKLLGLSFDQFTRAVVLPQGEFARFLHDKPAARQDLLVQLLGLEVYERMMQHARVRAAAARTEIGAASDRIDALAAATPEARAHLDKHAAACATARTEWQGLKSKLDVLATSVAEATAAGDAASVHSKRLGSIASPPGLLDLAEGLRDATVRLGRAQEAADRSADAVGLADAAVASGGDRDDLLRARGAHRAVEELNGELDLLVPTLIGARADAERSRALLARSEEHADALRTANAAHVVKEHLRVGEPCPVCNQLVTSLADDQPPEAWREARDAAKTARDALDESERRLTRCERDAEELERRRTQARTVVASVPEAPAVEAHLATLDTLIRTATKVRKNDHAARAELQVARVAHDDLQQGAQRARDAFRTVRDSVSAAGLEPPAESDDIGVGWERLVEWAGKERPRHEALAREAGLRAETGQRETSVLIGMIVAEAIALNLVVPPDADIDAVITAVAVEERVARDRIERLDAEIRERAELLERVDRRRGEAEVAAELARLLDANHFERWLVGEALARLIDDGSVRLNELSGGRYSFAFDETGRDFLVVDHAHGDQRRSARTLSGGETFQASLALALALADQLAGLAVEGAAKLESIFLDEGFGTLDAETLEAVATSIENLGSLDRMVGIVTHVPELAARMPVQYRVIKGARTSTVERVVQ